MRGGTALALLFAVAGGATTLPAELSSDTLPGAGVAAAQETPSRLLPTPTVSARSLDETLRTVPAVPPDDRFTSLLRIAAEGRPRGLPLNERRVDDIDWPEPFANATGDPISLLEPPAGVSLTAVRGRPSPPAVLVTQASQNPARAAARPRQKPPAPANTPGSNRTAIAAPDTPATNAPATERPAPRVVGGPPPSFADQSPPRRGTVAAQGPASGTAAAEVTDAPAAAGDPVAPPAVQAVALAARRADVPRRNPLRAAPAPAAPSTLPQIQSATGPASSPFLTASHSPTGGLLDSNTRPLIGPDQDGPFAGPPLSIAEEELLLASVAAAASAGSEASDTEPAAAPAVPTYAYNGPSPAELARTLVRLQDDIARGAVSALRAQRVVLRRIGADFPAYPGEVWADPIQARALLVYALSGGDPRVVRPAFDRGTVAAPYTRMVRGALAYLEGREGDAVRAFEAIDLNSIDHAVRGALALAKAALVVADDPAAADALLARARHAAPATLVEEAALRRATLIAAERNDVDQFNRLVNRYLRKFRASVYAGNFRRRLAAALTRMEFISEPGSFEALAETLEPMTDKGRRELYLLLARAAVEFGREDAGRLAAEAALASAEQGTMDHKRARLYLAAANVVHPDKVADAVEELGALQEEGGLDPVDGVLLTAAEQLSKNVSILPEPQSPPSNAPEAERAAKILTGAGRAITAADLADDPDDPFRIDPAVDARVDEALAAVDALLETSP